MDNTGPRFGRLERILVQRSIDRAHPRPQSRDPRRDL
jgi:hypothetical protein